MRVALAVTAALAVALLTLPAAASRSGSGGRLLFEVVPAQLPSAPFGGGPVRLWSANLATGARRDLGVVAGNEVQFVRARYTSDGRRIVFLHAIDAPNAPDARYSLDLMNADGSARRVLVRQSHLAQFAVSPDGRSIAVLAHADESGWGVYLAAVAHPRLRLLYRSGPLGWLEWPTPDRLVLMSAKSACSTGTCGLDPRTGKLQTLPLDARLYEHAHEEPAVSPDGTTLAFYSPFGPAGARVYGLDGRLHRNIKGDHPCVGPFSPDGTRLALEDSCGGTSVQVSLFDFASARLRQLDLHPPVAPGGYDRLVDWGPVAAARG